MIDHLQCPVCGFWPLDGPRRSLSGQPSYEICPSCFFQFGNDDEDQRFTHEQWRERWMARGMPWGGDGEGEPPVGWDPKAQLASLIDTYEPSRSSICFCERTATVAPGLAPLLADHLNFYDEILPHVYFGGLSQWAIENVLAGRSAEVASLLQLLESSYSIADEEVQNLIDVSFVENVQDDPAVVRLLGPVLFSRVDPPYQPK